MTFKVHGSNETLLRAVKFLREETTFAQKIDGALPGPRKLTLQFDEGSQKVYVPYFMNWLHFHFAETAKRAGTDFDSQFESFSA